jgi:hypothetical protein
MMVLQLLVLENGCVQLAIHTLHSDSALSTVYAGCHSACRMRQKQSIAVQAAQCVYFFLLVTRGGGAKSTDWPYTATKRT